MNRTRLFVSFSSLGILAACASSPQPTPPAQVKAAEVVQLASRRAGVMGVPLDINPHDAILECIRITAGEVAYASERISELKADEAVGYIELTTRRPLKEEKGAEDPSVEVEEVRQESPQLHIWIKVRQAAMDRLVNYSAVAIKAGIEERQIRLVERIGEQLSSVFERVISAIEDLTEAQRAQALVAYAEQLRLLETPIQGTIAA